MMRDRAVQNLLMSLFSFDELVRFLRFGPQGEEIVASLVTKASFEDVAYQSVETLNRRGLIEGHFFKRLKDERPNRVAEIENIERLWEIEAALRSPERVLMRDTDSTNTTSDRANTPLISSGQSQALSPVQVGINAQNGVKNKIFISYSHKDVKWLERLKTYLKPLEREGLIDYWDDTKIKAGDQWKEQIEEALRSAKMAVLLVSADFLASDFIANDELPPLLSAAEDNGLTALILIVGPCGFLRSKGLARFQAVNSPSKTLAEMGKAERDRVFLRLVERIEEILKSDHPR